MYEANRTLWVGNLSPEVDEELLFELFLQVGPLDKVTIRRRANTTIRYGFVFFKHECSVIYGMALMNGISLFGRRILLRQSITSADSEIPKHKKRASLEDHRKIPYQSPSSASTSAFWGNHIPVLGASQGPYTGIGNPVVQNFIPQYFVQDFKRRRTHHGYEFNGNYHFGMGSAPMAPKNISPNIVLCDHTEDKHMSKTDRRQTY